MKVTDKVAIVTGGASGIGKGLCSRLLENGAKFVAILDFDPEKGQNTATEFSSKYGTERVKFYHCDVTDESKMKSTFREVYDVYGALDIFANNAGIISNDHRKTIEVNLVIYSIQLHNSEEQILKVRKLHFGGGSCEAPGGEAFLCFRNSGRPVCRSEDLNAPRDNKSFVTKFVRLYFYVDISIYMINVAVINALIIAEKLMTQKKRTEKGVIINTASMAVFKATELTNCSYNASKHGVVGLTRCFKVCRDGFSKDIRCNAVCPALVMTGLYTSGDYMTKELGERIEANRYREISVDMVVDAFMRAIDDEDLNGALLKITTSGVEVDTS
ncbi:15-hydroxyprostaglandin dehydrogenase [NAD(+)] [Holothuria leucospilota]|uniref:15-hydroxyprostaglandin dehydrogenase [NAD(+)] n=1 Tax=Holothuria leucospilota TaxID=206669 RepID=A0A9Q1GYQ1_HOLLE|nr:15-hydroxyprostaglandin dehydrogenase [NAD(+)] [Holothuria leucospilota]